MYPDVIHSEDTVNYIAPKLSKLPLLSRKRLTAARRLIKSTKR